MRLAIIFIALVFSLLGFSSNLASISNQNILNSFFLYALSTIGAHIFLFLFLFLAVSFIVLKSIKLEKKHPVKNHILIIASQTLFIFITGIFTSFLMLIVIAVLELNFLSLLIDINPGLLAIESNIQTIKSNLTKNALTPDIITSDYNSYKQLQAVSTAITGTNSFYGKYVLNAIPRYFVIPAKKLNPVILIDKTLVISGGDKKSLETISPILTYLFVKTYFPNRYIKHFPNIYILNDKEHVSFRKADFTQKLKEISEQADKYTVKVASSSALIDSYNKSIDSNKKLIADTYQQKDKENNKCVAQGSYKNGIFIKTNSRQYCDSLSIKYDSIIQDANNKIDEFTQLLKSEEKLLTAYKAYETFFKTQGKLTDGLKTNIPQELGLFTPKSSIRIMIDTKSPHAIADYLEAATHEYLHYTSHLDNKGFKTLFFEEAFTEYFARNAISSSLHINTNMGFPVFVKIISQIGNMIPDQELADIYFDKDENELKLALNRVYGESFYKDNLVYFEALPYASSSKQILEIANKIMSKINGPVLKEKDLYSSETSY